MWLNPKDLDLRKPHINSQTAFVFFPDPVCIAA
jgi:hypothetical protein